MKSCKTKQVRRQRHGMKKEGKILCFLSVYILRHKSLCLFRPKTFRYLNQIHVQQRTTGYVQDSLSSPPEGQWWKIRGFFLEAVYKTLSCKRSFLSMRNAHVSLRNKCFFFEPSVVSTALNRKAGSD